MIIASPPSQYAIVEETPAPHFIEQAPTKDCQNHSRHDILPCAKKENDSWQTVGVLMLIFVMLITSFVMAVARK